MVNPVRRASSPTFSASNRTAIVSRRRLPESRSRRKDTASRYVRFKGAYQKKCFPRVARAGSLCDSRSAQSDANETATITSTERGDPESAEMRIWPAGLTVLLVLAGVGGGQTPKPPASKDELQTIAGK